MAKKMLYTLPESGIELPDSYWRVGKILIDVDKGKAFITFYCYRDQAARLAGKEAVAHKMYEMNGDEFSSEYIKEISNQKNIAEICYEKAMKTKDVLVRTNAAGDPDGEGPEQPPATYVSFFEGAEDLL